MTGSRCREIVMTVRNKLILAGVVLVGALSFLGFAGAKSGGWVYYLEVDHFVSDAAQYQDQRVRLHGKVATDDFATSAATLSASFKLLGKSHAVAIAYRGAIPDMFERGRDVVVEGRFDRSTSTFNADVLMTKCASKYESNSPHKSNSGGHDQVAANAKESKP
jgi:cytochrome c-type biogenesis protein CcmE